MSEKQSILGRISQLTKANINSLLDRAEDPQKMLDQLVRDFTNSIAEAEEAVAVTIGNLRLAEQDYDEDLRDARDWGQKAAAAARTADQARSGGDSTKADRFENLAKVAIGKQMEHERSAKSAEPVITSQRQVVEQLKDGLTTMRTKLDELKNRRDELVARAKSAQAQTKVQQAIGSINVMDPTTEISRFEEQVRREEAYAAGQAELQGASLEAQFAELEDYGKDAEIEARLAALRGGGTPQQISSAAGEQATGADEGSAKVTEDRTTY